jgi:hydroxylamine reductase (hybrid-cluster protein)
VGVNGEEGIRPLNDEEFQYLEKFNSEFVQGNFERDADGNLTENNLHYELVNGTEDSVKELKEQIKVLSEKLKESNGYREMEDRKAYWKYKKNLYKEYSKLKEDLEAINIVGNIYTDNYARRSDLMAYVGQDEITVLVTDIFPNMEYPANEEALFEYIEASKI